MKILLINNYSDTEKVKNLKIFLEKHGDVTLLNFNQITPLLKIDDYQLLVLSGSSLTPLMYNPDMFRNEIDLIKNSYIPIVGICYGFELLAYTYDNKLKLSKDKIQGIKIINYNNQNYKVWENHNWVLVDHNNLDVLGKSVYGLEVFKVKSKPFYGLQFHPENPDVNNFGYLIFNDILIKILE